MTGSLPIDLQFKGIGRLHVRSGTMRRQTRDAMKQMLRTLYQVGRLDVLRDLKANRVTRDAGVRAVPPREAPRVADRRPDAPASTAWTSGSTQKEIAAAHPRATTARRGPVSQARARRRPSPIFPPCSATHRKASLGVRARTFNKDRGGAPGLRPCGARRAALARLACKRVRPLKLPKERRLPVQSAHRGAGEGARGDAGSRITPGPSGRSASPGCGPKRCSRRSGTAGASSPTGPDPWHEEPGADRVVPRVGILVKPATGRLAFYRRLRTHERRHGNPYDLRRTYAQWLDLARIPQFRQDYYMAHGPKDLNALYKRMREVRAYLREDAAALEQLVGEPVMLRLVKVERVRGRKSPEKSPHRSGGRWAKCSGQ